MTETPEVETIKRNRPLHEEDYPEYERKFRASLREQIADRFDNALIETSTLQYALGALWHFEGSALDHSVDEFVQLIKEYFEGSDIQQ